MQHIIENMAFPNIKWCFKFTNFYNFSNFWLMWMMHNKKF